MRRVLFLALFVGLVALPSNSRAEGEEETLLEKPKPRQGYYVSLGAVGGLSGHNDRDLGRLGPWPAFGGTLRVGQAILPWLDIGIDFGVGAALSTKWSAMFYRLAIEAQLRPVEPLFVRLYAGFGATDVSRRQSGADAIEGRVGGTYGAAVGWEFYPGHNPKRSGSFAVAPFAWFEASPDSGFASYSGGIGIEITWWTGLGKNELILPDDEAFAD